MYSTVFLQGTTTIYIPKYSTKEYGETRNNTNYSSANATTDRAYVKTDHQKQEILLFDSFGSNEFLIKDYYNNLDWHITEETKTISGYQCIKATMSFRGMNWEAWFTPDIPLPYGPWKIHGLPGLIIELYDEDKTFTWQLEKIEYIKSDIFDKDFKTLVKTKNDEPISLKKFIEDKDEFHANANAERERMNPGSVSTYSKRTGYELKYEWEE